MRNSRRVWKANGEPHPPANTGGVLPRYVVTDWEALYRWANPGCEPMPGGTSPISPRPSVTLIAGGRQTSNGTGLSQVKRRNVLQLCAWGR